MSDQRPATELSRVDSSGGPVATGFRAEDADPQGGVVPERPDSHTRKVESEAAFRRWFALSLLLAVPSFLVTLLLLPSTWILGSGTGDDLHKVARSKRHSLILLALSLIVVVPASITGTVLFAIEGEKNPVCLYSQRNVCKDCLRDVSETEESGPETRDKWHWGTRQVCVMGKGKIPMELRSATHVPPFMDTCHAKLLEGDASAETEECGYYDCNSMINKSKAALIGKNDHYMTLQLRAAFDPRGFENAYPFRMECKKHDKIRKTCECLANGDDQIAIFVDQRCFGALYGIFAALVAVFGMYLGYSSYRFYGLLREIEVPEVDDSAWPGPSPPVEFVEGRPVVDATATIIPLEDEESRPVDGAALGLAGPVKKY